MNKQPHHLWFTFALATGVVLLLQPHRELWWYDRAVLWQQPWRLITAHLVHIKMSHAIMNLLALWLLPQVICVPSVRQFWLAALILCGWVSVGLWWFDPHLHLYAGLSGVLHGLYFWLALMGCMNAHERWWSILLIIGILLKISVESLQASPWTMQLVGAPVAYFSHQCGVFGGFLLFLMIKIKRLGCFDQALMR